MSPSTIIPPAFLLNLRLGSGPEPYVLSCSMVGETCGFSGIVRRFRTKEALIADLNTVGIVSERYSPALLVIDAGECQSFDITLNEAQKLSVILTDTTE
ncbi:MAG TPA: hypothetical protein VL495_05795 [Edaphobacter sp.]|nr:hypothetical protein [Edaphobacter sp.]